MSFCGEELALNRDEKAALHLVAIYAHARARALIAPSADGRKQTRLSAREIECLKWSSAGKTAWEIGQILSISERAVEKYIGSAGAKLNTVNKVHAVAEAMRQRILE